MAKMYRTKMLKKGNILTIDAIIAMIIAGMLITASYLLLSQNGRGTAAGIDSSIIAQDSLAVLEDTEILSSSAKSGSASAISDFLNNLPEQICSNISIYTNNSQLLLTSEKNSCQSSEEISVARNIFISENSAYYSEMAVWYK